MSFTTWRNQNQAQSSGLDQWEIARAAYDAAIADAANIARETAKRYNCNKRKALCRAIADAIEQHAKEKQ